MEASKRESKYWMCDRCAADRGLHCFKTGNTVVKGLCGWCTREDEAWLTPLVDLKDTKGITAHNLVDK